MLSYKTIFRTITDVLLPPRCLSCGDIVCRNGGFCVKCWGQFHWISSPLCQLCGVPYPTDYGIAGCYRQTPNECLGSLTAGRSAMVYNKASSKIILKLKYSDKTFLIKQMADSLVRAFLTFHNSFDVIVPVPLHWKRQLIRKYNQSSLLAQELSSRCNLPVDNHAIKRIIATKPLKSGSFAKRLQALNGAFTMHKNHNIAGKNILLIDDVWTTGATLQSCAKVLISGGAKSVSALTLARVIPAELS